MKKRRSIIINASSMADIAFLLLVFFLVATTIDVDTGIIRKLPGESDESPKPIHKRNILEVRINLHDDLLVNKEEIGLHELKDRAKEFIQNKNELSTLPRIDEALLARLGKVKVSKKHVISLQSDRGTSYNMYIKVQNELVAAYNELRDEFAMQKLSKKYDDLDRVYQNEIRKVYPNHISEAEPRNVGRN